MVSSVPRLLQPLATAGDPRAPAAVHRAAAGRLPPHGGTAPQWPCPSPAASAPRARHLRDVRPRLPVPVPAAEAHLQLGRGRRPPHGPHEGVSRSHLAKGELVVRCSRNIADCREKCNNLITIHVHFKVKRAPLEKSLDLKRGLVFCIDFQLLAKGVVNFVLVN